MNVQMYIPVLVLMKLVNQNEQKPFASHSMHGKGVQA